MSKRQDYFLPYNMFESEEKFVCRTILNTVHTFIQKSTSTTSPEKTELVTAGADARNVWFLGQ